MLSRLGSITVLSLVVLAESACGGDGAGRDAGSTDATVTIDSAFNTPDATPPSVDARPLSDALVAQCTPINTTNLALEEVANGFANPLLLTSPPGDPRLFVVERTGQIQIIDGGVRALRAFLDIGSKVQTAESEQGLLGLAFHPDYASNGRFFVNYIDKTSDDTVIAEYAVSSDRNLASATEKRLLTIVQPDWNHNGGMLAFGPDGYLYIGVGDGGSGGDPSNYAQRTTELLGSILRIDVNGAAPYAIPASNPFASGANGSKAEIWAYGLRNPWRFSFDRSTGDLYIGDVGQADWEEINVQPAGSGGGENYGWRVMEGAHCFNPSSGCDMTGKVMPVAEYDHTGGACSVTGGYVYRGSCLTAMQGQYFYGDFCNNKIWTLGWPGDTTPVDRTSNLDPSFALGGISSFGEDAFGELYVISYSGRIFKIVAGGL